MQKSPGDGDDASCGAKEPEELRYQHPILVRAHQHKQIIRREEKTIKKIKKFAGRFASRAKIERNHFAQDLFLLLLFFSIAGPQNKGNSEKKSDKHKFRAKQNRKKPGNLF